jgi:DNA modification methylase
VKISITDLSLDPKNARKHSARNLEAIAASLEKFGQRKPIVVHRGVVLAGNGTLEAAKSLGWTEIDVAEVPDDWDNDTAKAYALADNRTAELAEWDESELAKQLLELLDADWDIEELGFEVPALSDIDGDKDEDEVPEPPVEPKTKLGDMWQIGPHRILCGDSQDKFNLDRVTNGLTVKCVLTDPPYGINLDTNWSKIENNPIKGNNYRKIANDDVPFDASFIRSYFANVKEQFWWGANYYYRTLTDADLNGSWLVWDKRNEASDTVIGSGFELCWSVTKHKQDLLRYLWNGFTARERDSARVHPTQKPVAMLSEMLKRWAEPQSVVIDMFAGSGATLVAAHRTDRIGIGIELDPGYVDVIVARLEIETGLKAELVNVSN